MTLPPTVGPERWQRIQEIFHGALEQTEAQRASFLDSVCGEDETLRAEVGTLLEAHAGDGLVSTLDAETPADSRPGQYERLKAALADQYDVQRPLGAGGMATVYLAEDLRHNRDVAIKALYPDLSVTLGADRFLREIRIAAQLRHPNILPLYDSGEIHGCLYYVMPVEGESLRHRLARDTRVPLSETLGLAYEVLDALDYAHSEGVVHRDIKPENILLSRGHAIIADFGIARAIRKAAGTQQLTQAGLPIGTPAYMSPEQLVGDPRLDGRSDIYSVGCLLYEMLTGSPPRPGRATEQFNLGGALDPIPPVVDQALRKSLASQPNDRFGTAAEFAEALTSAATVIGPRLASSDPGGQSIAVLPFSNMSADPENEYFSDGITEEVINVLTQLQGLHVAARTSSFAFKGTKLDVCEIGMKLGVATVLEGSVRKAGNHLRIMAQLITVADGFHLWSERYDREMDDVFAIQDEIARTIAERLKLTLAQDTGEPIVKPPTKDLEAYQLYLKGRHLWSRRTKEALEQAVEYFEGAIAKDPDYALAHAGLADAYLLLGSYSYMPSGNAHAKTRSSVERALQLDDTLAEAHATLGQVLRSERDWKGEETEYRRAIEINPSYATAHQWYATLLAAMDRPDEAVAEIRRAEELDPLSHAISVTVAVVLFMARRYDEALTQLDKTHELEPNFASIHAWRGILYATTGQHEKVAAAVERAVELSPDNPNVLVGLAYSYAQTGERDKAVEIIEQASKEGARGWCSLIWAALGENDSAFDCMEGSLTGPHSWSSLVYLKVYPWFDPIRDDPRFEDMMRRVNLID